MKTLPGQELAPSDYAQLLEEVDRLLWKLVYEPVVDLVRPGLPKVLRSELAPRELQEATREELRNAGEKAAQEALKKALRDGAVQRVPDHTGKQALFKVAKPNRLISDALKSFGCRLNKTTDLWACAPGDVPGWVTIEAQSYAAKARALHESVKDLVGELESRIDELVEKASLAAGAGDAIERIAKGAWKPQAKKLETSWELGPAGQAALEKAFERSRGIPIKSPGTKVGMAKALDESTKREVTVWAKEALARLRAEVDENATQGYRAEGLAERIRNEYGVSKSRADLIARQETNNFMANFREARAKDAGLKRYQWYASKDARTRKDHKALHGQVFYYSQPPVTDTRTGARNNPGQDFRCRCVDLPVLE